MSFRIDGVRPTTDIHKADRTASVKKAGSVSKKMDAVALSSEAKDFQVALRALKDVPDVRENRVDEVMAKISSGGFNMSSSEIASRLLALGNRD